MKLWMVRHKAEKKPRERKARIHRWVSMAETQYDAIKQVRCDRDHHEGSWSAKELGSTHCMLDVVLR